MLDVGVVVTTTATDIVAAVFVRVTAVVFAASVGFRAVVVTTRVVVTATRLVFGVVGWWACTAILLIDLLINF